MPTPVRIRTSLTSPVAILSEVAGEGMTNFIEAQKVLLNLSKQQNKILMTAVKERIGQQPAAHAVADLLRRSVEALIHMQEEVLKIAGQRTRIWVDAAKAGKVFPGRAPFEGLPREGMGTFVKAQMRFLNVIAEETAKITGGKRIAMKKIKKTEFSKLTSEATTSFIDTQKQLVDIAGRQMYANLKTAAKALEFLGMFPMAFIGAVVNPAGERKRKPVHRAKRRVRKGRKEAALSAAA